MYDTKTYDKAGKLSYMLIKIAYPDAGLNFPIKIKRHRILDWFHISNYMISRIICIQLKGFADTFSNI